MPQSCRALLKDYCANSSFAGIHFIADDSKHWIERWFWLAMVVLSWYGSAVLVIAAWDSFVSNPISFGVETNYKDWNTEMPTVAICEWANDDKIYKVADTIWTPDHLLDLEDALIDIVYFRGLCYSFIDICLSNPNPDPQCPVSNLSYYAELVRSSCPQIIRNCSYNDRPFDCCEYFLPIDTDIGKCFILNSIQTNETKRYPMVSNMKHKRGVIKLQIFVYSMMYTIGQEEVPSITTLKSSTMKIQLGNKYRRHLTVRNIENDPLVVHTTPEQRKCRYYTENENGVYPYYSYSACTVQCRQKAQIEACNCNDHFMLGATESQRCNITGMACLHSLVSHLTTLKPAWALRSGLVCDCQPSCNETEITVIKDVSISARSHKKKAEVEIHLAYLPTERFKRNVVRSHLDLVVSIGGTTGLFVGASILSFVELIFYFTVRFAGNVWMERQKRKTISNELQLQPANIDILQIKENASGNIQGPYATSGVGTSLIQFDFSKGRK